MATGKQPDFILKAMNRNGTLKSKVGAAWSNEDGSISIRLDPYVVIDGKSDTVFTLFAKETEHG